MLKRNYIREQKTLHRCVSEAFALFAQIPCFGTRITDIHGQTNFNFCFFCLGRLEMMDVLIAAGSRTSQTLGAHGSLLMVAVIGGHKKAVKYVSSLLDRLRSARGFVMRHLLLAFRPRLAFVSSATFLIFVPPPPAVSAGASSELTRGTISSQLRPRNFLFLMEFNRKVLGYPDQDVNEGNHRGWTPLMQACREHRPDVCTYLVQGRDPVPSLLPLIPIQTIPFLPHGYLVLVGLCWDVLCCRRIAAWPMDHRYPVPPTEDIFPPPFAIGLIWTSSTFTSNLPWAPVWLASRMEPRFESSLEARILLTVFIPFDWTVRGIILFFWIVG